MGLMMLAKLSNFISERVQRVKVTFYYRFFFKDFGKGSKIIKPIKVSCHSARIGRNVYIAHHARIEEIKTHHTQKFEPNIIIDDNVTIEQRLHIVACNLVKIGKHSCISYDVMITDVDHSYKEINKAIQLQPLIAHSTIIGERCFIGAGVKINAGNTLGEQCIVGANSVVRGDFPDYSVIVGAPARIIKRYCFEMNEWRKTDKYGQFIDEN
ncbi:acyltransferase [Vibrio alginolyticus]|nr:acyltransferase [Vibrio alginolyticus]